MFFKICILLFIDETYRLYIMIFLPQFGFAGSGSKGQKVIPIRNSTFYLSSPGFNYNRSHVLAFAREREWELIVINCCRAKQMP